MSLKRRVDLAQTLHAVLRIEEEKALAEEMRGTTCGSSVAPCGSTFSSTPYVSYESSIAKPGSSVPTFRAVAARVSPVRRLTHVESTGAGRRSVHNAIAMFMLLVGGLCNTVLADNAGRRRREPESGTSF